MMSRLSRKKRFPVSVREQRRHFLISMSEFHLFELMLPEHKDDMSRQLILSGSPCTAIMLACTCKHERLRYQKLGFRWPMAAARLSAARNGYFELFKWLIGQCHPFRFTDKDYFDHTWQTVCATPNLDLFKWYAGPGYFFSHDDLPFLSWHVFAGVIAGYLDAEALANVLSYISTKKWGLSPYYYVKERFGAPVFANSFYGVGRAIATCGTVEDLYRLELESVVWLRDYVPDLLCICISEGNITFLQALFEHWPDEMKTKADDRCLTIQCYLSGNQHLSVSLLETCRNLGIIFNPQIVVSYHFAFLALADCHAALTPESRMLIKYAGWELPADIENVHQCTQWLSPQKRHTCSCYVPAATAVYRKGLVNSL